MKHLLGWELLLITCIATSLGCEDSGDRGVSGLDDRHVEGDSAEPSENDTDTDKPRDMESDDNPSNVDSEGDGADSSEASDSETDSEPFEDTATHEDPVDTDHESELIDTASDSEEDTPSTSDNEETDTGEEWETETDIPDTNNQVIFPLAKGNVWTYKVSSLGSNTACRAGTSSSKIDRRAIEQGKYSTYRFQGFCKTFGSQSQYDFLYPKGDRVINYETRDVVTDSPVSEGHQWQVSPQVTPQVTVQWEFAGQVTVPAGTFNNCWNRTPVEETDQIPISTYCRGIGPIRVFWPGRTEAILVSYTVTDTNS